VCGFRGVPWRTAEEGQSMNEMFAQGDLLIERVADVEPSGTVMAPDATGVCVLAEPLIRICKCCFRQMTC
jgi:hypothetical protein